MVEGKIPADKTCVNYSPAKSHLRFFLVILKHNKKKLYMKTYLNALTIIMIIIVMINCPCKREIKRMKKLLRVLIVEDSKFDASVLTGELENGGYS